MYTSTAQESIRIHPVTSRNIQHLPPSYIQGGITTVMTQGSSVNIYIIEMKKFNYVNGYIKRKRNIQQISARRGRGRGTSIYRGGAPYVNLFLM